jgi:hypothetical protein
MFQPTSVQVLSDIRDGIQNTPDGRCKNHKTYHRANRPPSSSKKFLPHVDTGSTVSIFGTLPENPFLSECQALSAVRPESQWYQTGVLEIGKSQRVPNHWSTVGGRWQPFVFRQKLLGEGGSVRGAWLWWGCDTVHSQFLRQNPLACPITNSHLLSNAVNGRTPILTDEPLNSCNSFRSCTTCGSPCVFVIVNWCATGPEPGTPLKHLRTTQYLFPEGLLNHCLRSTFPKTGTKFDTYSLFLSLIHRANRHRPRTLLQITACENCPRPPSYVQAGPDMVILPSNGALCYRSCCIDGVTSPEYLDTTS